MPGMNNCRAKIGSPPDHSNGLKNMENLISRDEARGGQPIHRAQALLFLIESRTAQVVSRLRYLSDPLMIQAMVDERDLDFIEAFSLSNEPSLRPTVEELEYYANRWASLVADNARLRASLAQVMS